MDNLQTANSIEIWARKMGFSPTTPQSSVFFQKLSSNPKMKLYMDLMMRQVKPIMEVKKHQRRYVYGILKEGRFSCTGRPNHTIENENDVKLFKKYKNISANIKLYREFVCNESLEELKDLKCTFKKNQNFVDMLLRDFCSFKTIDMKLSTLNGNLVELKAEIVSNKNFLHQTRLKRSFSEDLYSYLTADFVPYENDIQKYLSTSLKNLMKKSPEKNISLLINALNKLDANIEFKMINFDLEPFLLEIEDARLNESQLSSTSEEITDVSINSQVEKIKILYEKQNNLVDSINNCIKFIYSFDKLKERNNKLVINVSQNAVKITENILNLSVKLEEFMDKVKGDLKEQVTIVKDSDVLGTVGAYVQTTNEILNKWNTHMDDINASTIISEKVNRKRLLKSLIESNLTLYSTHETVQLETDTKLVESNHRADELIKFCDILHEASEESKQLKRYILKNSQQIELVEIDDMPMSEVKSQLLKDCKELEAMKCFIGI